jgi:hypothetical protein
MWRAGCLGKHGNGARGYACHGGVPTVIPCWGFLGLCWAITMIRLRGGAGLLTALFLATTLCSILSAQEKEPAPTKASCLTFVQQFYRWCVPESRDTNVYALELALKQWRFSFSGRLVRGLEAVDAEARHTGEAGLDFDPILNSQDSGDPGDPGYLVGTGKVSGKTCRVEVARDRSDGKGERVIPELSFGRGHWFFVNFHYPNSPYPHSDNLLSLIKGYLEAGNGASRKPH